jgi:hypothetical protein
MTNELGITREDIEAWTKQSVVTEVNKALARIDIDKKLDVAIDSELRNMTSRVLGTNTNRYRDLENLRAGIAVELAKRIDFSFSLNQKEQLPPQEPGDGQDD